MESDEEFLSADEEMNSEPDNEPEVTLPPPDSEIDFYKQDLNTLINWFAQITSTDDPLYKNTALKIGSAIIKNKKLNHEQKEKVLNQLKDYNTRTFKVEVQPKQKPKLKPKKKKIPKRKPIIEDNEPPVKKRKIDDGDSDSEQITPKIKPAKETVLGSLMRLTNSVIKINLQSNVLINGITKSGKSTFISNLFSEKFWSINADVQNVYLFSKIDVQEAWKSLKENLDKYSIRLTTFTNLDDLYSLKETIEEGSILIIDDFMVDAIKDKKLMSLFTDIFNVTTHHKNIISIFTLHNLFADGFRTMRLNSDWIFLFSNPVDVNSIKTFFRQLENEEKATYLFQAYKKCLADNLSLGIKVQKTLDHKYFYGFEGVILFVTDQELNDISNQYSLKSNG